MQNDNKVIRALIWSYGSHLVNFIVTLAGAILLARLLSPKELGIFGVASAISIILTTISYYGVSNYLIRDENVDEQTLDICFTINSLLSIIVSICMLFAGGLFGIQIFQSQISNVLVALAFVPLLNIFELLPASLMMREMGFSRTSPIQVLKALVNVISSILFALHGWSYLSPALGAVAGAITGAVAFTFVGRKYFRCKLSFAGSRKVCLFAFQMIAAGGVPLIAMKIAELLIATLLGLNALGIYSRAATLATIVWDGAYGLSTRVVFVRMAQEQRETGQFSGTLLTANRYISAVIMPMICGIALLSGPIVAVLYGEEWSGVALPLSILMAAQFISVAYAMNWEICILVHKTAWQAKVETYRSLITIAAFAFGGLISLPVACFGKIIESAIGFIVYRKKMPQMLNVTAKQLQNSYKGSYILVMAAIMPSIIMYQIEFFENYSDLLFLVISVAAGVVSWVSATILLDHPVYTGVKKLIFSRHDGIRA